MFRISTSLLLTGGLAVIALSGHIDFSEHPPDRAELDEIRRVLDESRPGAPNDIVSAEAAITVRARQQSATTTIALPYRGALGSSYTIFAPTADPGNGYWLARRQNGRRCVTVLRPVTPEGRRGAFAAGTRFQRGLRNQALRWAPRWAPRTGTSAHVTLVTMPPGTMRVSQRMRWRGGENMVDHVVGRRERALVAVYSATSSGHTIRWQRAHPVGRRAPRGPACAPQPAPELVVHP